MNETQSRKPYTEITDVANYGNLFRSPWSTPPGLNLTYDLKANSMADDAYLLLFF